MSHYCGQCGSLLNDGAKFCEKCGQPISTANAQARPTPPNPDPRPPVRQTPATPPLPPMAAQRYVPLPPVPPPAPPRIPPYAPPPARKPAGSCGRSALIAAGAAVGIVVCVGLAGLAIWLLAGPQIRSQMQTSLVNLPGVERTATALPEPPTPDTPAATPTSAATKALIQIQTEAPTEPAATLFNPTQPLPTQTPLPPKAAEPILLDYTAQWQLSDTSDYVTDISQQGYWILEARKPLADIAILTPKQPGTNVGSYTISVNVESQIPGETLGLRCQVQDEKNYYQVALKGDSFAIGKVLDGTLIPLTDPVWQRSQFIGPHGVTDATDIAMVCMGSQIGFLVNGTAETPLVADSDNSFTSGGVAVFAMAGKSPVDGFYTNAGFRGFKIEAVR
jgi:hypothetical protein